MINVGIIGGETPLAGELLRILINHPDVVLRYVVAEDKAGYDLSSVHHGLIGEHDSEFSSSPDWAHTDLVFIATEAEQAHSEIPDTAQAPELCVVDLTSDFSEARTRDSLVVYGVPEVNRKALVRGAKRVVIPSSLESIASVALYPLAMRSMLPGEVLLSVEAAPEILQAQNTSLESMVEQLTLQEGNTFKALTKLTPTDLGRVIRVGCDIDLPVPIDNISDMYEELYSDHNLTFIVGEEISPEEVEGTDKCIISLDKSPDGRLQLRALADAHMRGGAGDAVHVMNLLMGLYEKTGLALKASRF